MTDEHVQGRPVDPAAPGDAGGSAAPDATYLGDLGAATPGNSRPDIAAVLTALTALSSEHGETRALLVELREHLGDVLEDVAKLGKRVDTFSPLYAKVADLADAVAALAAEEPDTTPRPVDLAHIAPEDRAEVLGELVTWVRTVLFTGWPWTQRCLRPCWLQHPDLVNAMLWLRVAYAAAYDSPRARPHNLADWHRWLDDVMQVADRRTEHCPAPDSDQPHAVPLPPRDDSAQLDVVARRDALAEIHRLMQIQPAAGYPEEAIAEAKQRVAQILDETGLTQQDYNRYYKALVESEMNETVAEHQRRQRLQQQAKQAAPQQTQHRR